MAWWPFKRRAVPTPPETPQSPAAGGDSAEDWAAGDLAECVDGTWFWCGHPEVGPAKGDMHRVVRVDLVDGSQFLNFGSRFPPNHVYEAIQFRKITPKADAIERADADFIQSIKPKVLS